MEGILAGEGVGRQALKKQRFGGASQLDGVDRGQ